MQKRGCFTDVTKMPGVWEQESLQRYIRCAEKVTTTNDIYGSFYSVDEKRTRKLLTAKRNLQKRSANKLLRTQSVDDVIFSSRKALNFGSNRKGRENNGKSQFEVAQLKVLAREPAGETTYEAQLDSLKQATHGMGQRELNVMTPPTPPSSRLYRWHRPLALPDDLPEEFTFGIQTIPEIKKVPLLSWERTPAATPCLEENTGSPWLKHVTPPNGRVMVTDHRVSPASMQGFIMERSHTVPLKFRSPASSANVRLARAIRGALSETDIPSLPPIENLDIQVNFFERKSTEPLHNGATSTNSH